MILSAKKRRKVDGELDCVACLDKEVLLTSWRRVDEGKARCWEKRKRRGRKMVVMEGFRCFVFIKKKKSLKKRKSVLL